MWGPKTMETRRCPHGKRMDDYCIKCQLEWSESELAKARKEVYRLRELLGENDLSKLYDKCRVLSEEVERLRQRDVLKEDDLIGRIKEMPEEDRRALDPIADALHEYLRRERPPIMALPNRVIALACVDLLRQWQKLELERE